MAEVYAWCVRDEDENDIVDITVHTSEYPVHVKVRENVFGELSLTPKQARELARDLNAAAKAASH